MHMYGYIQIPASVFGFGMRKDDGTSGCLRRCYLKKMLQNGASIPVYPFTRSTRMPQAFACALNLHYNTRFPSSPISQLLKMAQAFDCVSNLLYPSDYPITQIRTRFDSLPGFHFRHSPDWIQRSVFCCSFRAIQLSGRPPCKPPIPNNCSCIHASGFHLFQPQKPIDFIT
jgi:hypothetical protein